MSSKAMAKVQRCILLQMLAEDDVHHRPQLVEKRSCIPLVSMMTIRSTPHKKQPQAQTGSVGLHTCPEFSSQFCTLFLVDWGCSKVLDVGDILLSEYMREAGAKSGQLFVRRVVDGFIQALKMIIISSSSFINKRGVSTLIYLVCVNKLESRSWAAERVQ